MQFVRCMSPHMAHRVISRAHNNQVAFREKRTSDGGRHRLAQSKMTHKRPGRLPTFAAQKHRSSFAKA